jgi:hypothetical protein
MAGSSHSLNTSAEYKFTNTTSMKLRANRIFQSANPGYNEYSLILREQISENFWLEGNFTSGQHDELKLTAKKQVHLFEEDTTKTTIEAEAKIRKSIVS